MKTTISIPDHLFKEGILITRAETKKDAVIMAMEGFVKFNKLSQLAAQLGTFENFLTKDELQTLRRDHKEKNNKNDK